MASDDESAVRLSAARWNALVDYLGLDGGVTANALLDRLARKSAERAARAAMVANEVVSAKDGYRFGHVLGSLADILGERYYPAPGHYHDPGRGEARKPMTCSVCEARVEWRDGLFRAVDEVARP